MTSFWGYAIPEARVIHYDKNDKAFSAYLAEKVPSSKLCIGCGSCTATCTAGNLSDFNIRKLQMMIRRGETEKINNELPKCMLCGKCSLVCPRGVDTRTMILAIFKYIAHNKASQISPL